MILVDTQRYIPYSLSLDVFIKHLNNVMKKLKHIFAILLALGLTFLFLIVLDDAEEKAEIKKEEMEEDKERKLKPVTVMEVSRTSSYARIQSFGEVKPRWKTIIKAKKRSEILTIAKSLEAGKHIKKGEVLFTFNKARYQTQWAEAQNQIAQAQLLIQSEKEQARLARQDWRISRKKGQPSAFKLRIPQIKAMQAQLKLAKAQFNEVKSMRAYAKIVAPYNGIVVSRSVNVGDVVEAGQVLAEIFSADDLGIALKLNEQQWKLLKEKWRGQSVDVLATSAINNSSYNANKDSKKWSALIERDGGSIDQKTRQRTLHLILDSSKNPLAGSFVRVDIRGKLLSNILRIPRSALTLQGDVWFVDASSKLRHFNASVLFSNQQSVFVKAPPTTTGDKKYSIVVSPLSSFLPGIEVQAIKR